MAILLTILKIIGIVLLCILGLVILLLLMVLFVPLRYKVKASYDDNIYAYVKATYLLHIVSFTLKYTDKLDMKLRILGIPINLKKKDTKPKKVKEDNKSEDESQDESSKEDVKIEDKPKKSMKENLDMIKGYLDILSEDSTKAAFKTCKKRLGKMLKCLLPRKMDIVVKYGLKDPYITSVVMTVYDVFYTYLGRVISLFPIYYEETIDAKAYIKGHIRVAPILWQGILVILDANCRRFYKKIRRENARRL